MLRLKENRTENNSFTRGSSPVDILALVTLIASVSAAVLMLSCSPETEKLSYVPDNYATWMKTTQLRLDYAIPGHEDNFRIIYINDTGLNFARSQEGQSERIVFPEGTIIAKEVYAGTMPAPGSAPMMVTAMVKATENPDARGGWVWVTKDLSLGTETVIKGDFCFTCHANANEAHPYGDRNPDENFRDFVFFIPDDKAGL